MNVQDQIVPWICACLGTRLSGAVYAISGAINGTSGGGAVVVMIAQVVMDLLTLLLLRGWRRCWF